MAVSWVDRGIPEPGAGERALKRVLESVRNRARLGAGCSVRRFWLECGEATIALEPRAIVIGRSRSCDLVVNDAAVSRRHAQLEVNATQVTIEDLGSSNGVMVNGSRIAGTLAELQDGDQIQIGPAALVLKSEDIELNHPSTLTPQTTPGLCAIPYLCSDGSGGATETEATEQRHALVSLGIVADKLLAMGRVEDAERMLTNTLQDVLTRARDGHAGRLPVDICPKAAWYAVELADATGHAKWVDYVANLYFALNRPLPADVVDRLYETVRRVSGIDLNAFRHYVEHVRALRDLNAADRFLIQRLQGVTSLLSSTVRS